MGTEPFIGEISMFAGTFAPRGWAFCDGQLLAIAQNTALFSILGTNFGGDGRTTFGLPDLRGRAPVHAGSGPGLTPRSVGEKFGSETVTLTAQQIAPHRHELRAANAPADSDRPQDKMLARATTYITAETSTPVTTLQDASIADAGGGQPHGNVQPSLCINYIIALQGIFPSRN